MSKQLLSTSDVSIFQIIQYYITNNIFIGFTLYFDEDYQRGYQEIIKRKGQVTLGDMKELLTVVMGFEPLDDEVEFFVKVAGKDSLDYVLSFEELIAILNKVRDQLNETAKKSVNYKSYGAYTFDCCKHRCAGDDPNVVFKSPVTKGMTYGFYNFKNQNLNDIHRPIIKCDETKYADSQVRLNGGNY